MNENQKKILLKTAKQTIDAAVHHRPAPVPHTEDPVLLEKQGCFVTIKNRDQLRGCIGQFTADRPLIEMVSQMAYSSCMRDPRFAGDRIRASELPELDIEISVLSSLEKTDDPLSLRLGIDGIYITDGLRCGCFLPQVATETGWSAEEFLSYCCAHKAGLPPDAWKTDPRVETYLFSADVFGAGWNEIQ
ncbi:MAG TPA: AmmeMemoRadiSam system protein A [Anaerohalosphaeraceae bacterium]|nr:AmmeMemoRadiSam system protein A [Phycisphaerae bacterium]HOK95700.1 AmmeMemoRadiSam system protein A [Anaerohalosphaeraceae bacterium]HOL30693.1 AmmeMemoRadiSam system protein A [Anaerohalosphaeraceae bacterium]HOM75125.1 AmmeMemoRadiSam system protein A [Anaerohalosphaeraceae bacterium]HPC63434.1 AmmeMemoRadiSam system protein A [Anaerohalosphaeraceae bacterium]